MECKYSRVRALCSTSPAVEKTECAVCCDFAGADLNAPIKPDRNPATLTPNARQSSPTGDLFTAEDRTYEVDITMSKGAVRVGK